MSENEEYVHYMFSDILKLLGIDKGTCYMSEKKAKSKIAYLCHRRGFPKYKRKLIRFKTATGLFTDVYKNVYDRKAVDKWIAENDYDPRDTVVTKERKNKSVEQVLEEREIERLENLS